MGEKKAGAICDQCYVAVVEEGKPEISLRCREEEHNCLTDMVGFPQVCICTGPHKKGG